MCKPEEQSEHCQKKIEFVIQLWYKVVCVKVNKKNNINFHQEPISLE